MLNISRFALAAEPDYHEALWYGTLCLVYSIDSRNVQTGINLRKPNDDS